MHQEALLEHAGGAGLGVEQVQGGEHLGADLVLGGMGGEGVGVEFDDAAAGAGGPVAALVLEQVVEGDVVEQAEAGGADEG
jgi:hypothetical protein